MKTNILGVGVDTFNMIESVEKVIGFLDEDEKNKRVVITPNPEMIMEARDNKEFKNIINNADLVVPDGIGVVLASKLEKIKIKERVPGCELAEALFNKIKDKDKTVYLLGAAPGVAEKAKENMENKYKGLNIIGIRDGYFKEDEEKDIIAEINKLEPNLLLVGIGFPRQEKFIYNNDLKINAGLAVGGTIDVMAGEVKRAPEIFQKLGLEWFYRLIKEPSRIGRMMVLPKFVLVVILDKIKSIFR